MSRVDLFSAALRHARDARHCMEDGPHGSPDQAFHLAGYGPECAIKGCLSEGRFDRALGHELAPDLLDWVLALDGAAHRRIGPDAARLAGWRPEVRYEATGTTAADKAGRAVADASAIVDGVVAALWADGELREVPR